MGCGASQAVGTNQTQNGPKLQTRRQMTTPQILVVDHDTGSTIESDVTECPEQMPPETELYMDDSLTAQALRLGYPPPKPPSTTKADVISSCDFSTIDKHASKVSEDILNNSFEEVAEYLTQKGKTDLEKARAIFSFITHLDLPALERSIEDLPEPETTLDYLLKIQWQMGNHAHLLAMLSRAAGLPCLVVTGFNKSAAYQVGSPINTEAMTAQWNAICLDGQWRLVDVYWASTCVVGGRSGNWTLVDADGTAADDDGTDEEDGETILQVNEFFFLTDPGHLISTHFPDEVDWQLLESPRTLEEFEKFVYIRERFFQIGMTFLPESVETCAVNTKKGECVLTFAFPPELAEHVQFRYLLFKSRQKAEKQPKVDIERFVFYQKSRSVMRCTTRFPIAGRFKMDIFGQVEKEHENFDLVCSYLIECNDPQSNFSPLPDMPDIGWGPGVETEKAGLTPTTHTDAVIETKDGMVEVRFATDAAKAFVQNLKNNDLEEFNLGKHGCIREENGEIIVNLRLPGQGDYALNIFADSANVEGDLPNVCNYLVKCLGINEQTAKPFPNFHSSKLGHGNMARSMGIQAVNHQGGIIEAPEGRATVSFKCDSDVELFCELHHTDIDRTMLSNAVQKKVSGNETDFDLLLPSTGEYAMNVFARKKSEPDRIFHVHTYMVKSGKANAEEVPPNKKDAPLVKMFSADENTQVRIPNGKAPMLAELTKKNSQQTAKPKQLTAKTDGDHSVFTVHLPELGEYNLNIYDQKTDSALVQKCGVHIVRTDSSPQEKEAEKEREEMPQTPSPDLSPEEKERRRKEKEKEALYKAYREQLKQAMHSQDPAQLHKAINDFVKNKVPEVNSEMKKAKDLLNYLTISQVLSNAMSHRNLQQLEQALATAEKAGLQSKLNLQIKMARKILEQLRRIEKLRHAIMDLDQKTIAEIKSYSKPPEAVHEVMVALFLLLGDREKLLREWKQVQILIGKTGKDSLKRRVTEFKVEKLDIHLAVKAQTLLKRFTSNDVRDVSSGAATFYVWATGMIEECESRFAQDGGDLSSVKVTRPKTGNKKKSGRS